jgi:hypothetical protein
MKKRLTHISPLQAGIVQAVVCGILSLIAVPFIIIVGLIHGGIGALFAIFLPIVYAVAGFIAGAISALVYNLVATWTGDWSSLSTTCHNYHASLVINGPNSAWKCGGMRALIFAVLPL